jgi:hypothetical protein
MGVPTKTGGQTAFAWADVATANVSIGTEIDVSALWGLAFDIRLGRNPAAGAFTAGWPNIRIEGSPKASGNDAWAPQVVLSPAAGSSLANTTLNGAILAGATSCVVTSASNIAAGDLLFLGHTTTPGNYEIVRVKAVSGTTVTFEEGCTNAHDSGAVVTDQAEIYPIPFLDVSALMRVRVVVDNANSGRTIAAQALYSRLERT